jgi:hypothetical protein
MSDVKLSPEAQKALQDQAVKSKVEEMTNLSRLVANNLNLICSNDVKIPSAYAKPVAEIQAWLEGMHKNISTQLETLKALLPQEQAVAAKVDEKAPVIDADTDKAVPLAVVVPTAPEAPQA